MVSLVQCPRGQEHNPAYFHLPFFIGERLVPAHMRNQLPPMRSPTAPPVAQGHPSQLDRIEAKLDALLDALAEEEDEQEPVDLEGNPSGGERDQNQGL